jgi:hypothetical protein
VNIVFEVKHNSVSFALQMVVVAQLVRASDCGSEGRGFEPPHPPQIYPGNFPGFFILSFSVHLFSTHVNYDKLNVNNAFYLQHTFRLIVIFDSVCLKKYYIV